MSDTNFGAAPQSRRAFVRRSAVLVGGVLLARPLLACEGEAEAAALPTMTVYKDAGCGCCKEWITHVEQAGFKVVSNDTTDMASVKASFGVPASLGSCHTARVGTYAIEGHVPADLIIRLLKEKPQARGLAVPGMPNGSPGMEQPGPKQRYDVLLFDRDGKTKVYASR